MGWELGAAGVVELPSGARLRGRGLRDGPAEPPEAEWTLVLLGRAPVELSGAYRWVRWRDFRLPADREDARDAFLEAHGRSRAGQRVEVVCRGGRGRTGTAIACIACFDGVSADRAVRWTRERYHRRAAETPWQRAYVRRFAGG